MDDPRIVCATGYSEALEDGYVAGREAATAAWERVGSAGRGGRAVVLLFASVAFDLAAVVRGVRSVLDAPIVGCTTFSEATDEGYFDDSVSLMVLAGEGLAFGIGVAEGVAADPTRAVEAAWSEARAALGAEPTAALSFPDAALVYQGEVVTEALHRLAGGRVAVAGGCPGDGGAFKKTYQVAGERVYTDAVPVLLLRGVTAHVVTRTGWRPVGEASVVTRAEGNRVLEVDGRPAVDFIGRYLATTAPDVIGTYPIALMDETARRAGREHYVIRSPFGADLASGAVVYGGCVREGARVQLGRNAREDILASVVDAGGALRAAVGRGQVVGVLFASCGARKLMLGSAVAREARGLAAALDAPMVGFYSYGEIGAFDSGDPDLDRLRFHNCTLVVCALVAG